MSAVTQYSVEDAIITALVAACTTAHVERFEGNLANLDSWLAQVPVGGTLAVFYAGRRPDQISENAGIERIEANFMIWFVSDRLRGYDAAVTDTGGIYALLGEAESCLRGNRLNLAMNPLRLTSEQQELMDESSGRIIWSQQWTTSWVA